jgi:hypothetical protein
MVVILLQEKDWRRPVGRRPGRMAYAGIFARSSGTRVDEGIQEHGPDSEGTRGAYGLGLCRVRSTGSSSNGFMTVFLWRGWLSKCIEPFG